jgi:hypothetical protein
MKNIFVKKIHLFFSSLFVFIIHLPFVFAKAKPANSLLQPPIALNKVSIVADTTIAQNIVVPTGRTGLYDSLQLDVMGLSQQAFDYAMKGFILLKDMGKIKNTNLISIVDFSKPSSAKRLFVIDIKKCKLLFNTYVAHGINSGKVYATIFSNKPESNMSSVGFFETSSTYEGKHGYSLHLQGFEKGINDNAYKRDIVIHGADYVHQDYIRQQGYIGRSLGCPAIPESMHKSIIDKIKNGSCFFIFSTDKKYLTQSKLLNKKQQPLLAATY